MMEQQKQKQQNTKKSEWIALGTTILILAVPTGFGIWLLPLLGMAPYRGDRFLPQWLGMMGVYMVYALPLIGLAICTVASRITNRKWHLGTVPASLATLVITALTMFLIYYMGVWMMVSAA